MFELQQVQNLSAVASLLLFLKVFKYLAVIPQMNLLFETVSRPPRLPSRPMLRTFAHPPHDSPGPTVSACPRA